MATIPTIQTVYKYLDYDTDVVAATNEATAPLFNGNATISKPMDGRPPWYTGANANMSDSFVPVYDGASTSASHLFDVSFCSVSGGAGTGSMAIAYKSLATKLLGSSSALFSIGGTSSLESVAVWAFPRQLYRDRLDPGNWELILTASEVNVIRQFTDDSSISSGTYTFVGLRGNIYSGTIADGPKTGSSHGGVVGHVYYDLGLIMLNPSHSLVPTLTGSGFITGNAAILSASEEITARSVSLLQSSHYYCRAYNSEFNFSNNPTFANQTNGNLLQTEMINNPFTYPTTIGLYNDNNELIAYGKLSNPVEKSFNDEAIFLVRLDF